MSNEKVNLVYEKIITDTGISVWIVYDERAPLLIGTGKDCNEALNNLTSILRAIITTVITLQKDCE